MNSQKPTEERRGKARRNGSSGTRATKAVMLIFIASILAIVLICLIWVWAIDSLKQPAEDHGKTYIFHEADYDLDIFSDAGYLELDRNIYYEDSSNGMIFSIASTNLEDVPTDQHRFVSLLCDFVNFAVTGDADALNSLFSDEYIDAGGKTKMDFTMQQLYNIKISYIQTLSEEVDGDTHISNDYWLEYMIRKNNGTFRNDMESDCVKKEYVRVTDRDGNIGIDVLSPYNTEKRQFDTVEIDKIIAISAVALLLSACVVTFACVMLKKSSKQG